MSSENDAKIRDSIDTVPVRISIKQRILGALRLGKQILISPKSHAIINHSGYEVKYHNVSVSITIGIGKYHTAELSMDYDAWKALNDGEEVHITTTKEFNKKYEEKLSSNNQ